MSEEEKKAIEKLKEYALCKVNDNGYVEVSANGYKHTILKLIENQQKELNNIKEIEKSHKEENGKLIVEFEKVYEDNLTLANELEQEKLKNKDMKSAVEYLKKIEPEKLKIIADSWNDKVAHKFDSEIKELTQKAFEDGQESIVKRYISKDKIQEKIRMYKLVGNLVGARALELLLEEK